MIVLFINSGYLVETFKQKLIDYAGEFKNEEKMQDCFSLDVIFDAFFQNLWHDALTDSLLIRELFLRSNR